jgi:peptide deformylase
MTIKTLNQCVSCLKKSESKICKNKKVIKRTIKDLEDTLEGCLVDGLDGIGLSAIQIFIPLRIAIIRMGKIKIDLINPKIIEKQESFRMQNEGCLSIPRLTVDTRRYKKVKIINDSKEEAYEGLVAVAVQHEIDHMNRLTILDRKWKNKHI